MGADLTDIISCFDCEPVGYRFLPLTVGHINQTYRVNSPEKPLYILQQINHKIFRDIEGLMNNTEMVLKALSGTMRYINDGLKVQQLVKTRDAKLYHCDDSGNYWRLFSYIEGGKTIETVRKNNIAYEGGRAFGLFLDGVSSIKPSSLAITIPDFHSMLKRYSAFLEALSTDAVGRSSEVQKEIALIKSRYDRMQYIPNLLNTGGIPERVVHNDTKFNNLIFSENGKAIAVTDLDTVMPGSALFDFGDAIRTAANTAREDEPNLQKVGFDIAIFEAFAAGYIESAEHLLVDEEIQLFPEAAMLITYTQGMRFLTDFLNGDTYYRVRYPRHNLVRANVQLQLFREMEKQMPAMRKAIGRILSRLNIEKS
ncbi:MAG TPA: aminoglycoside phosphotransferase family protein [Lentimicrobium sp.]|nr:aminoglycoside phosphotransferase family protein [Lentimicrobium sp.]